MSTRANYPTHTPSHKCPTHNHSQMSVALVIKVDAAAFKKRVMDEIRSTLEGKECNANVKFVEQLSKPKDHPPVFVGYHMERYGLGFNFYANDTPADNSVRLDKVLMQMRDSVSPNIYPGVNVVHVMVKAGFKYDAKNKDDIYVELTWENCVHGPVPPVPKKEAAAAAVA